MTESHIVEKNQPCGECGSSDAVQVYSDGHAFCYSCNHNYKDYNAYIEENNVQPEPKKQKAMTAFVPQLSLEEIASLGNKGFRERLIDKRVTAHFGVTAGMSGDTITEHYYPYTIAGKLSAFKKRVVATKEFQIVGEFKDVELFGQSVFREGGKRVVLTEGELDAMSYAQACLQESNQIYPVVSMPSATGIKAVKNNRAWLRSFDEVILWLDNDEAGENGLKAVAKAIGFDKVKVVKEIEKRTKISFSRQDVPTGMDICKTRLLSLIDKVENVKIDEQQIAQFMPDIYKKLEWLERDDLIKHFVSTEFNRYLSYYKNARDINISKNSKSRDKKKHDNPNRKDRDLASFAGYYINIGFQSKMNPGRLMGLINECLRSSNAAIGNIEIMKTFSFFEIEEEYKIAVPDELAETINTINDAVSVVEELVKNN